MGVTANKCMDGNIFNKCNAVSDNKMFTRTRFSSHISIHCEKCGDEIGDNDPVFRCRYYITAGHIVYSYEWKGWYSRDGAAKSYKRNNHNQLSVCSNCVGTYFENRNQIKGECLFCNRTVIRQWSYTMVRQSYRWFCNRLHKEAYYNRKQRGKREAKRKDISCFICNIVFTPKRSDATTCSNKCRQKMYRGRHQNTEQTTNFLVSA